jgi:predicted amidophosphoribosyltransferase
MLSNCCSASPIENTDLCSACKEHADFYPDHCPSCGVYFDDEVTICSECLATVPDTVDPF